MAEAHRLFVSEIFSAIQGEGKYAGVRQIFLRLAGCDLRCTYCDEPGSLEKKPGPANVEIFPGSREFTVLNSPLLVEQVVELILAIDSSLKHHSLSVTGGEPLLQVTGLSDVLSACRDSGMRIAIETSGTRAEALRRVCEPGDIVSMDVKLNSVDSASVSPAAQREFLECAIDLEAELYCKAVVSDVTDPAELIFAASWISEVSPHTTLYLQPVTSDDQHTSPSAAQLLGWQAEAMSVLADVRVLPQVHKLMGQK